MIKRNPKNERIKRQYGEFLKHADGKAKATIRQVEKAIQRYENFTSSADFATFDQGQARAFKAHLVERGLSKATMLSTVTALKRYFGWLAHQPGYKSRIAITDIEYLNLADKEARAAKAPTDRAYPTIEQVEHAISRMPARTDIERRDRAFIAFTAISGVRDGALISLRVKHVDPVRLRVIQNPKEVATKASKRIDTFFFPVSDICEQIVLEWLRHIREVLLFGDDDPLFPKTLVGLDGNACFIANGLCREFWASAARVREVFKTAFVNIGLPPFTPHSFRHMLAHLAYSHCSGPEAFKAWSQNLGHESPLTTFTSYGTVATDRQGELVRNARPQDPTTDILAQIRTLVT
jgi:integrase